MTHPILEVVAFLIVWVLGWGPGNWLLWTVWIFLAEWAKANSGELPRSRTFLTKIRTCIAKSVEYRRYPSSRSAADIPTRFAPTVGGLERALYIASVMSHHFELAAGWLVMKAFFGWMRKRNRQRQQYNEYLIGNLLSLLIGLFLGAAANLFIRWQLGVRIFGW
jgi:hypothetical protein